MNKVIIQSESTSQTIRLGKSMGSLLRAGDVVALVGELGAGKTQFIKGLASGAGVGKPDYVSSPSFTMINEYPGKVPFYHIDLFRLESQKEAEGLGLEDYLHGGGITSLLPEEMLSIHMAYTGKNTRSIEMIGKGKRYDDLVSQIQSSEFRVRSPELKNRNYERRTNYSELVRKGEAKRWR
jgi:tRNA threonylcarbamoyladenosine biosynthesis protein TsaE